MGAALVWLRRDFRLRDNPAVAAACSGDGPVYAVYCLDELTLLNKRQRDFVLGSIRAMRLALEKRNVTLSLLEGAAGPALVECARRLSATSVHSARAYVKAERAVEDAVAAALGRAGVAFHAHRGDCVHEPEAVAQVKQAHGEGYRVFPPFFAAWRSLDVALPSAEIVPSGRDATPGPLPDFEEITLAPPGEAAALAALEKFTTARAADYAVNAQYPGRDGSSNLAPYLRFGCISPRVVHQSIGRRMSWSWTLAQERASMAVFMRQLALRDFFIHLAYFVPEVHDEALQTKMRAFEWSTDRSLLDTWRAGRTGYPLIDAAIRQLRNSGLVHQRAAICAASFLCFDLGIDWRLGRDAWMEWYLAADDALCDGNWQWLAGVGSDQAAYPRIYNPEKQARQFDAQAVYVRRWIPELKGLPTAGALAPWRLDRQSQVELRFFTPDQYPKPVVDHEKAAREFLARYRTFVNPVLS